MANESIALHCKTGQRQRLKKGSRVMTTMTDLAGYIASTMVLLTFMTKDMRLLRILGIFSNIAFITYGVLAWLPPVLCLHLLLLPVNVLRLHSLLTEEGLPAPIPRWSTVTKFFGAISGLTVKAQLKHVPAGTNRFSPAR
jgi:hypothetical protein